MALDMTRIPSYKLIPQIDLPPAENLSSDTLNKKVTEVSEVIKKEEEVIQKTSSEINVNTDRLFEIQQKESTWTNRIVDWLATHEIFAFLFSTFGFFQSARQELTDLKTEESEYTRSLNGQINDIEFVKHNKSSHTLYMKALEEEIAVREAKRVKEQNIASSFKAVYELFNSEKNEQNVDNGETEYNKLPVLKVTDIESITLSDVTSPIMRFDQGFVIKQKNNVGIGFGDRLEIQVFYTEKDGNGTWKAWTPPEQMPLIKVQDNWIEGGQKKPAFNEIKEFIQTAKAKEKIDIEYDFEDF